MESRTQIQDDQNESSFLLDEEDFRTFLHKAEILTHFMYASTAGPEKMVNHFILLGLTPHNTETNIITIAHSRQESGNKLEFLVETLTIGKQNDFLDLKSDITPIYDEKYPKTKEDINCALKRMDKCLIHQPIVSEEEIIKFILTGEGDVPYRENKLTSVCSTYCHAIKTWSQNIGHKTALFLAIVPAIIGALLWHPYVRLIVAVLVAYEANITMNGDCYQTLGKHIIREAENKIYEVSREEVYRHFSNLTNIIQIIKNAMNSNIACRVGESIAKSYFIDTCVISGGVWAFFETIFLIFYLKCSLTTRLKNSIITEKEFNKKLTVRIVAGYTSGIIAIIAGVLGQKCYDHPALLFFVLSFVSGLISRYLIAGLVGCVFVCFSKCDTRTCNCCKSKCFCIILCLSAAAFISTAIFFCIMKRFDKLIIRAYL